MNAVFCQDGVIPILCTAIHNGNFLRPAIAENLGISSADQLREEDPHTDFFTEISGNRVIVRTSRFQVDLNRPRERAVYLRAEDAWDLPVRSSSLSAEDIQKSLKEYDVFYARMQTFVADLLKRHRCIFVFDLHSYNHQRKGPGAAYDNPEKNPEIILGTNNMPQMHMPLIRSIQKTLQSCTVMGHALDARINVKFPGGHFSRWLHATFPGSVICLALELRKDFMNEWSGEVNPAHLEELRNALASTIPVITDYLAKNACQ